MINIVKKILSAIKNDDNIPEEFQNIEIHANSLKNKPNSYFVRGSKVHVINNRKYVEYVQKSNGGWNEDMSKCINKICTVCEVDSDRLIRIRTPSNAVWLMDRSVLADVDGTNENKYGDEENKSYQDQSVKLFQTIENDDSDGFFALLKTENLNIKDSGGRTPMNLACFLGRTDIVQFLCEVEVDIGIPDILGNMPIHNCVINGHMEILKIIVNKFPETIHQKQENGQTLINIAQRINNKELLNYINDLLRENNKEDNDYKPFTIKKMSYSTDKSIGFSMDDPPVMLDFSKSFQSKKEEVGPKIDFSESFFKTLKLDNAPMDNSINYSDLSLKINNDSEIRFKKIICKNCKNNSVNFLTKCGHCLCSQCFETIEICPVCATVIDGKALKIFV